MNKNCVTKMVEAHAGRKCRRTFRVFLTTLAAGAALATTVASADSANGTISYQSKSGPIVVTVKNVYPVKSPDAVSGKAIRRLVFASADLSAKIKACVTMSCSDGDLGEGIVPGTITGPFVQRTGARRRDMVASRSAA